MRVLLADKDKAFCQGISFFLKSMQQGRTQYSNEAGRLYTRSDC